MAINGHGYDQKSAPHGARWLEDGKPTDARTRAHSEPTVSGYPEILGNICKIMGKGETIWATRMSILPWNANSYVSRSLRVIDMNVSLILGLWWDFSCMFISLHIQLLRKKDQLLITSSVSGACVRHFLWASQFTCEMRWHFLSSGGAPEAWGGGYLPSSKTGWRDGQYGSPAFASLSMTLPPLHPTGWW